MKSFARLLLLLAVVPPASFAGGGTIQFSASSYSVNENAGSVTLTLTRAGGSAGQVAATYNRAQGSATYNTDFTGGSGELVWANGDTTSKNLTFSILDAHVTGGGVRSFTVFVTAVSTGATIGTPGTATVNITDNDPLQGQFLSGSTVPTAAYGNVGDLYLDTANGKIYGPKTASGWGGGTSLIGPPGPPGKEGNANINSYQVSPTNADWLWNSLWYFETSPSSYTEYFSRYYTITDANITQDILNNGFVDVYVNPNPDVDSNQWVPLPYRFLDSSANFYYFLGYQADVGQITLHFFLEQIVAGATIPAVSTYDIPTYSFKVVYGTGTPTSPVVPAVSPRPLSAPAPAAGESVRVVKP